MEILFSYKKYFNNLCFLRLKIKKSIYKNGLKQLSFSGDVI